MHICAGEQWLPRDPRTQEPMNSITQVRQCTIRPIRMDPCAALCSVCRWSKPVSIWSTCVLRTVSRAKTMSCIRCYRLVLCMWMRWLTLDPRTTSLIIGRADSVWFRLSVICIYVDPCIAEAALEKIVKIIRCPSSVYLDRFCAAWALCAAEA